MNITLFTNYSDLGNAINLIDILKTETDVKYGNAVPYFDVNVITTIFFNKIHETYTEEQIMKFIEDIKWKEPGKIYIVIQQNGRTGISSFKGNHKGEFTRIFREGIVVNMFV